MADMKVVILAAGKGKRMGASIPKPLVPILGKPMVEHLLDRILTSGIDKKPVVIVSPDGKPLFEEALGDRVGFAVQEVAKGTGDALRYAEEACAGASHMIVLYGDHPFIGADVLKNVAELMEEDPEAIVMLTSMVPNFEDDYAGFIKWGRILRDAEGNVAGIREAKDCSEEQLAIREVNPGIYAFPTAWAFDRLKTLTNENASGEYYIVDLIAFAMQEGKRIVTAEVNPLEVVGVNTPEELARAEKMQQERH